MAGLQRLEHMVHELGLLIVAAEAELLHAAEADDDVVEAPEKIDGQEDVAGVAE